MKAVTSVFGEFNELEYLQELSEAPEKAWTEPSEGLEIQVESKRLSPLSPRKFHPTSIPHKLPLCYKGQWQAPNAGRVVYGDREPAPDSPGSTKSSNLGGPPITRAKANYTTALTSDNLCMYLTQKGSKAGPYKNCTKLKRPIFFLCNPSNQPRCVW